MECDLSIDDYCQYLRDEIDFALKQSSPVICDLDYIIFRDECMDDTINIHLVKMLCFLENSAKEVIVVHNSDARKYSKLLQLLQKREALGVSEINPDNIRHIDEVLNLRPSLVFTGADIEGFPHCHCHVDMSVDMMKEAMAIVVADLHLGERGVYSFPRLRIPDSPKL